MVRKYYDDGRGGKTKSSPCKVKLHRELGLRKDGASRDQHMQDWRVSENGFERPEILMMMMMMRINRRQVAKDIIVVMRMYAPLKIGGG